ncbi:MAG: haloacid dehalogenase-like hydrolase, partial [Deltaproteobacteria bacterium]|nr:haloacid dehalogenase-like hydrolase [Deltaproteobacteria bacterium]
PGIDAAQVEGNDVVANARLLLERSTDAKLPAEHKISTKDAFYNIVSLLAGMRVEDAEVAARRVYEQGSALYPPWRTHLFADRDGCSMRRIIETLKRRGMRVYLLSAGLDVLSWAAADALDVPRAQALGSLLAVKDGVYTGEVRDSTYTSKGPVIRQWLAAPPILVFGDSPQSDFDMMLEAAAAAFMVNPRPAFQERDDQEAGGRFVAVTFDGTERDVASP